MAQLMFSLIFSVFLSHPAYPCAPAPPKDHEIVISEEEALIIWDGKTQHFLRRGVFESDAEDFGFLVPSPTKPILKDVSDGILSTLAHHTQAKRIVEEYWEPSWTPFFLYILPFHAGDGASIKSVVVERTKVAGMDAAILKTEDPASLEQWLVQNHYPFESALKEWAQHYIEKDWYITAFKIDKEGSRSANIESQLIHMQFDTARPFFPYKEPENPASSADRSLRVFMISPQPPAPQIGDGETRWPGKIVHAKAGDYSALFQNTPLATLVAKESLLGDLVDRASPRPGMDELGRDGNTKS